ncbi:alpha-amylase [Metabacillus bambusae]|uniref:Alpha-amylase n=1 Tax=Metabacillus bambusae TaxID=2795218 RepID=A0ABS3MZL7_9BACI|nr:alpha-amylase [Metabacillus bambusae]MBO1511457.1 alpha-amylase [Metabacillus bambusae]
MERNRTMMQFFEWHVASDGSYWSRLKEMAQVLSKVWINTLWIPPVTKGQSSQDTGYGVYDLYDLGEFDQKGTVRTKYGTKDELIVAINECHKYDIQVYVDLVLNHKAAADETEVFKVVEVNPQNRKEVISEPFDIEGWTKFTFPGRGSQYSSFKWNFEHFNGTDYDNKTGKMGIYRILGDNKNWNENVSDEFGNYDYLMFANIDYNHPSVIEEVIKAGKWIIDTLQCDGFRLDAIKHIKNDFLRDFVTEMLRHRGKEFYFVGEFWNSDVRESQEFLDSIDYRIDLFDVALHYKLHSASKAGRHFNLATIFDKTLVQSHPHDAVTFVDNHDSQPNEALESWIEDWFKQIAYALILLRRDGYPVVFYGDYFGIAGDNPIPGKKVAIDPLLNARYHYAYGDQDDYFDHPNTIGWVRLGTTTIERSGCAVIICNSDGGNKKMFVGTERAGEVWVDITRNRNDQISIDDKGFAMFPVNGGSVSVWALPEE